MPRPSKKAKAPLGTLGFARAAGVVALLTFGLIVLGGTVRVFEAGLSCPDWPKCYGLWWPFPVDPAYGYTNFQVFLEWVHRLLAAVVGGLALGLTYWAYRLRQVNNRLLPMMVIALVVLALQVKLGGLTVLKENVNWSVAAHLGNALIFYTLLLWVAMVASRRELKPLPVSSRYRWVLGATTVSLYLTILMGAMVSKSYAGGVCGGLFSCLGDWLPTHDLQQLLHMKHRFLALTTVTLGGLTLWLARHENRSVYKSAHALIGAMGLQVVLGIVLLYSFGYYADHYRALSAGHLALATVVFTFAVTQWGKLWWGDKPQGVKILPLHG